MQPPPFFLHMPRHLLREQPESAHVHVEYLVPTLERVFQGGRTPDGGCVVHQDVEPPHLSEHLPDQGLDVLGLRQVGLERPGPAPQLLDRLRSLAAVGELARRHEHVGAGLGQSDRNVAANPAAAAGDQRCSARQVEKLLYLHFGSLGDAF